MSSTTTEPIRAIAADFTNDTFHLAYRFGDDRYTLSYPRTEMGIVRALIHVQRWLDADCNFDRRACDEACAKIEELSDILCEGK